MKKSGKRLQSGRKYWSLDEIQEPKGIYSNALFNATNKVIDGGTYKTQNICVLVYLFFSRKKFTERQYVQKSRKL